MIKVKICGVRRLEDAIVAAEAGADFIGLVFVPGRPRRLAIDEARTIVDGLRASADDAPQVVGLFADQPLDEVNDAIRACRLDRVQLCGGESIDFCRNTEAKVIQVLHVAGDQSEETVIADLLGGAGASIVRQLARSSRARYLATWFARHTPERRAALRAGMIPVPALKTLRLVVLPLTDLDIDVLDIGSWDFALSDLELL